MILDASCGLKMMWYDKHPSDVVFVDLRKGRPDYSDVDLEKYTQLKNHRVSPTVQADNRNLPFLDEFFDLVVFDPPHVIAEKPRGIVQQKYGVLNPFRWRNDLHESFKECARVLKRNSFLIFKWSETNKIFKEALTLRPSCLELLFGSNIQYHKQPKTFFVVFRKEREQDD